MSTQTTRAGSGLSEAELKSKGRQNEIDKLWLKSLLDTPNLSPKATQSLKKHLRFLEEGAYRTLGSLHPGTQNRRANVNHTIRMAKAGPLGKVASRAKMPEGHARQGDGYADDNGAWEVPEWLSNPALLPREPPGGVRHGKR